MKPGLRLTIAWMGALSYGTAGALMGSMNAGWFDLGRNSNATLPLIGIGAGLISLAFYRSALHARLREVGGLYMAIVFLLTLGVLFNVLQPILEFAILGTFGLGIGLICLSIAAWRRKLVPLLDRILITLSAAGSLMWNTETTSAFLLVGVALLWVVISFRLLIRPESPPMEPAS